MRCVLHLCPRRNCSFWVSALLIDIYSYNRDLTHIHINQQLVDICPVSRQYILFIFIIHDRICEDSFSLFCFALLGSIWIKSFESKKKLFKKNQYVDIHSAITTPILLLTWNSQILCFKWTTCLFSRHNRNSWSWPIHLPAPLFARSSIGPNYDTVCNEWYIQDTHYILFFPCCNPSYTLI